MTGKIIGSVNPSMKTRHATRSRGKGKVKSEFYAKRGITVVKKTDNRKGCLQKTTYKAHSKRALVALQQGHILVAASELLPSKKSDKRLRSSLKR